MEAGSVASPRAVGRATVLLTRLRPVAFVAYLAALAVFVASEGVPANRDWLFLWIVLGLLVFSLSNVRGWARSVVLDWLPFGVVLWVYDLLRGAADGLLFAAHYRPQLEVDAFLFGGTVPTVWLQDHLWHGASALRWWDYAVWAIYMTYFLATYLLAAGLWLFARERFRPFVATVCLLAAMGFTTYALFPAAPPWLAGREGELEYVTRTIRQVSVELPLFDFGALFERGSAFANPVAAVPSLHAAYTLLFTLVLWRFTRRGRPLLALYPLAMSFALVYSAEHYVSDILLGFAYAVIAFALVRWMMRIRSERAVAPA
jgi:hypothetical protein